MPQVAPKPEVKPKPTLEERLEYAVECMETNYETEKAYRIIEKIICKIADNVTHRKPTAREINLVRIAFPVIQVYTLQGKLTLPAVFWGYFDKIKD